MNHNLFILNCKEEIRGIIFRFLKSRTDLETHMTKYVMQVNQTNGVHIALSVGTEISKGGLLDCDQLSARPDIVTNSITTFR